MTADREKTIADGWYSHIKFQIFQITVGLFLNPGCVFLSSIPESWKLKQIPLQYCKATWQSKRLKLKDLFHVTAINKSQGYYFENYLLHFIIFKIVYNM